MQTCLITIKSWGGTHWEFRKHELKNLFSCQTQIGILVLKPWVNKTGSKVDCIIPHWKNQQHELSPHCDFIKNENWRQKSPFQGYNTPSCLAEKKMCMNMPPNYYLWTRLNLATTSRRQLSFVGKGDDGNWEDPNECQLYATMKQVLVDIVKSFL